ncbi:unnamed protein product [Withania somnifera]
MATADSYIGSLICLITKSDIRYEGFLFHLDAPESTIGLRNVKSYGTEGRKKDGPQISPSDKIYEYIFFRGNDIKDLQVISSPSPQSTSVVPDDPAIIQTQFPNPTPSTIGMTSFGAAQVAGVSTSAPSMLPFLVNLPPNSLLPSSSLWGASLPPPPVNINGPAVANYWPGLVGSSGGVSHFRQQHSPLPPQSLVASLPIQQQAQNQNVNALAGGSSVAAQHHPLLLPFSTTSPNLLPAMPSSSGQSNPVQPAKPAFNLSSIPLPNYASRSLPAVAVNSCPRTVSSLEAELNANAILDPVTKEPSSVISTSDSFPTFSKTVSSVVDTKGASISNLARLPLLTPPEVQSGVKDSSLSQSMQTPNFDVHTVQASVSEPLPSGSTEETSGSLRKSPTRTLRGSTSSHHNRGHFARGRDGNPHVVKRFSEDFDFEAMNEKFNKKEVWDFLGRSNKAESDDEIGDEKEMDDSDAEDVTEDGSAKHDYKLVYCKDDFFDSLSCHTLDRESGKVKFSEQRKKNAETFGEIQKNQRGRGCGARISGASQQSYRGRGYDNARGGRGQGRTVWGRVT